MEDKKKKKKKTFLEMIGLNKQSKRTEEQQKKSKFFADNIGDSIRKRKKLLESIND